MICAHGPGQQQRTAAKQEQEQICADLNVMGYPRKDESCDNDCDPSSQHQHLGNPGPFASALRSNAPKARDCRSLSSMGKASRKTRLTYTPGMDRGNRDKRHSNEDNGSAK